MYAHDRLDLSVYLVSPCDVSTGTYAPSTYALQRPSREIKMLSSQLSHAAGIVLKIGSEYGSVSNHQKQLRQDEIWRFPRDSTFVLTYEYQVGVAYTKLIAGKASFPPTVVEEGWFAIIDSEDEPIRRGELIQRLSCLP